MDNGICHLAVIPMRAEPSHCAEMVSQLLFGEAYRVHEVASEWVKITACHDGYEGWIQRKQYFGMPDDAFDNYLKEHHSITRKQMEYELNITAYRAQKWLDSIIAEPFSKYYCKKQGTTYVYYRYGWE